MLSCSDLSRPGAVVDQEASRLTASIMQLAIAPVFLISAVAVLLTLMAQRYGRVIDRTRTLLREGDKLYGNFRPADHLNREIRSLYRRARLLRTTIILSSLSIFFIVLAIFLLFLDMMFHRGIQRGPELSFLCALIVLLVSTVLFIEDFAISLPSVKHDIATRAENVNLEEEPKDQA